MSDALDPSDKIVGAIDDLGDRIDAMRRAMEDRDSDELRTTRANLSGALGRLDRLEKQVAAIATSLAHRNVGA